MISIRTIVLMLAAAGCATAPARQRAYVQLGTPCPALTAARDGAAPQRLLLEIGDLTHLADAERQALAKHQSVAVEAMSVASGVFTHDERGHVPWSCAHAADAPNCQISLTPTLPKHSGESVRLSDIQLHATAAQPSGQGPEIELRDQQTRVIELNGEAGDRVSVAITPYLLQSDADFATLLACKRAARTQ